MKIDQTNLRNVNHKQTNKLLNEEQPGVLRIRHS